MWKTPLPPGHSSPVLTDSRIFLTAHSPEKDGYKLFVHRARSQDRQASCGGAKCRARQTGRRENVNGPASPSPVTDGANVYAFFQEFGLISYTADGKERWRMPLGPFNMFYGFGASPILVDGMLILPRRSGHGLVPARGRREDRQAALEGRRAARHLRLLDADDLSTGRRAATQILDPRVVPAHGLRASTDGKQVWWVRGLACEMKSVASIDGDTLYVNGWGFPQNQPGTQIADGAVRRGPEALRQERRRPGRARRRSRGDRADGPDARPGRGFPALRLQSRRQARRAATGTCSARCSPPRTACSRSSSAARAT